MKTLILATAIVLSALNPLVYADEASQKLIAEDLLQTMKVDQMTKPLFDQMRSMMDQQFTQMGASEDMKPILKRYTDKLLDIMEQTLNWQNLKEDMISIYMHAFTEDELKGMLAFYKSPVGQSVIQKMPTAMQQSMVLMQKHMPELLEKLKKISEELAEEIKAEKEKQKRKQGEEPEKTTGT
jgi:uncharacterized protein